MKNRKTKICLKKFFLKGFEPPVVSVNNHYHRRAEGIIILSVGILHDLEARLSKIKKKK